MIGASTSEKSERAGVVEEAYKNQFDVLTALPGKKKYSDAWLLDSECTYHMCPKGSGSMHKSSILMGNDAMCKTAGIANIHMKMFDGHI